MKKIICLLLTLLICIPQYHVFAKTPEKSVIESVKSFSPPEKDGTFGTEVTFKGNNITASFHMSAEQITLLKEAVCDENLAIDPEQSKLYLDEEITFSSIMGEKYIRISFNDKANSNVYQMGITDEKVAILRINYDSSMNPLKKEAGVYAIKNQASFEALYNSVYESALAENEKNQEEYEINADDVENLKILYYASFNAFGSEFPWGFLSYNIKNESKTHIAAYYECRLDGGVYYIIADSWQKDNTLYFGGTKNLFVISEDNFVEISDKFNKGQLYFNGSFIYNLKLQFKIDRSGTITDITAFRKRTDDNVYAEESVDMNTFNGTLIFPEFDEFKYEINSTQASAELMTEATEAGGKATVEDVIVDENLKSVLEITSNTEHKDNEQTVLTSSDGNLISKITEDNVTLYSIMFNYNADGDKVNISKVWHELEADEIYDDVKEIWNKATFSYTDKISDKSTSDLIIDFSKANEYRMYAEIFDGYIKIYNNETEKNPEYYSYTDSDLYGKYTEIFKSYVNYELENFIKYEDISDFNPKYTCSFEITLPDVLKNSWIDEVSENGKVKITVFHKSNSDVSHITLEGNSKSYSLMRDYFLPANYLTGENTTPSFTTDIIGIDKDTPIPHHFDEGGAIVLSWSTCTQYEKNDNLTVDIYTKKDASKRISEVNVNYKSPTAKDIAAIKLTEALTEDDFLETPVEPKSERGLVFDDVPENHWAHKTIENFYYATIVRGVGNRLYAPDDSITYEHFGFLLDRLFGYKYENTLKAPALRQDVITALVKACGIEESDTGEASILDKFSDKDMINPENLPYVQKAVEDGLVIGYGGALNANGYLTRAETVTLLYRALKNVYGVTDNDIAENYKLKVIPKNSKYMSVRGIEPYKFYIKNNSSNDSENKYIVYSTDSERLNGELLITFGDDVYEDTNIYAVCLIDGNYYVIESTSVYSALFRASKKLMFYINVYKNGELIIENAKTTLYYSPQDDDVELYGDGAGLYFFSAQASTGRLPEAPNEVGIAYENHEKFNGGKEIYGSGTLENVSGDDYISDMYTLSTGFVKIMYSPDWSAVDMSKLHITSESITLGNRKYVIEPVEYISYSSSEITGLFNIICDDESIAEKIPGKITGINSGLGKYMEFSTDDNVWKFKIQISEIDN